MPRKAVRFEEAFTRFGNTGDWTMPIGGGQYGSFVGGGPVAARDDFDAACVAALTERTQSLGADRLLDAARKRGVKIGTEEARHLLRVYAASPASEITHTRDGYVA
jgi:hypothetical protein